MNSRHDQLAAAWVLAIAAMATWFALLPCRAAAQGAAGAAPTAEEARRFVEATEQRLLELWADFERALWVNSTYLTDDTEIMLSQANARALAAQGDAAKRAARFAGVATDAATARKLELLRLASSLAAPADTAEALELARLVARMRGHYANGRHCPQPDRCLNLDEITRRLASSREPAELLDLWAGWHRVARPMRADYTRFVELANKGARELGFADTGAMWRSWYDMPPAEFAADVDRLWAQVRPLYLSLHAYVRWKLRAHYGDVVPADGPIPAHLLGNLWAQQWDHVWPLVAPAAADPGYDLTAILRSRGAEPVSMVKIAEAFFTSVGFAPLPKTFWERSQFSRPRDRDVVCHAAAASVDRSEDVRLRMCIDITARDFATIHHELGHSYYDLAYARQPPLFRDGASDAFHEAIGDAIELSVTPAYLAQLGYIDTEPDASRDIGLLLQRALDKVAFLPFGLLVDQWRWKVFAGEIAPAQYNAAWSALRLQHQGVAPPVERSEADFDPGAKFHVPANVPYMRYFLSFVLQFQIHRALAQAAGCTAPLHRCSIHGNPAAGAKLREMMALGSSRPWPDALELVTGQRRIDADALLEYFAPLRAWLDEQNVGRPVGW